MKADKQSFEGFETDSSVTILLVDDNKINQFLGKKILRNLGIVNVDVASDGNTALQMLKDKKFTVLLTDVEMPGMNGYELTAAVRQLDKSNITIIALTANASETERQFALENGMNDYLSKPYSPADLLNVLRKHVLSKSSFIIEETTQQRITETNPVRALYSLFNGNKQDVKNLLLLLHHQLPESLCILKQSILNEDWEITFHCAHKLKSTVKLFNDDKLFNLVNDLTENARVASMQYIIPSQYDELNKCLESILVLINKELESI